MTTTPRKNRLWVVGIIAASAATEILASWLGLGSVAGFPRLHLFAWTIGTGWTLAVGMEAYAGYALWVWLAAAPGERSRRFAMASSVAAIVLSLAGQVGYHLILNAGGHAHVPSWLAGFAAALPVIVLGFAAFLTHLMHADAAAAERAETGENAALRATVSELRAELEAANAARTAAENRAADAEANAARAARKAPARTAPKGSRKAPAAKVPNDIDARAEALRILEAEPDITGAALARRCGGMSERWGQLRKKEYAGHVAGPDAKSVGE